MRQQTLRLIDMVNATINETIGKLYLKFKEGNPIKRISSEYFGENVKIDVGHEGVALGIEVDNVEGVKNVQDIQEEDTKKSKSESVSLVFFGPCPALCRGNHLVKKGTSIDTRDLRKAARAEGEEKTGVVSIYSVKYGASYSYCGIPDKFSDINWGI